MKQPFKRTLLALINSAIRVMAFCLPSRKSGLLEPGEIKRILVYGQMGIGNMILFTPFLKALRAHYSQARIRLLFLNKNGAEQVLEGSKLVDEIVVWHYQDLNYRQRISAIRQMKRWQPDLIVSRFASQPVDLALVTLLSRAPYRVGHVTSGGWRGRYDYLNNYPVPMAENEHEIDRYLRLAGAVGIPATDRHPYFHISDDDVRAAREFLVKHGFRDDEPFVTLQMGTSPAQSWKRWQPVKWAELARNLLQDGLKIVAVGSPDERTLIEETLAKLKAKPVIAAGELTLKQTAAIIKRSRLLVCNDSGLMHTAVAMDTPVVAILGPSDYTRTAPSGKKHVIIRKDLPCSPCLTMQGTAQVEACQGRICLELISVAEVLEAVRRRLKTAPTEKRHSVERSRI